jgi:methylamine dehydrogenase accessory protein MauD
MNTALLISNITLWVLVVGLSVVVMALARQIGVLHERIAPAGALMVRSGPLVGEASPIVAVTDMDGRKITLGAASESARSTLVFFLSPTCPVCKTLLPVLRSSGSAESDWLDIILASDGDLEEQKQFISEYNLSDFTYVLSEALGMTYKVSKLPFALLLDEEGVIRSKGLVNSREHLESLFEAKERGVSSVQEYLGKL